MQFLVGGWKELTFMTLSQKIRKITKVGQSEHIFVISSLEASSCIHSFPKKVNFSQKLQTLEGDQKELTSKTWSQIVGKISKIRQSEHIFGNFSFQASSCFHSYPKIITFAEKCKILYVTKTN